jgi:hypothetical protein
MGFKVEFISSPSFCYFPKGILREDSIAQGISRDREYMHAKLPHN